MPHYNIKNFQLKKNYKACKETWKYGPYTGEKARNRNCPGGNPDTGLIKTLNQLFYMYKEAMSKELKKPSEQWPKKQNINKDKFFKGAK